MRLKFTKCYLIALILASIILASCKMENDISPSEKYTLGIWTAKTDMATEFIKEWTAFAEWTSQNVAGAGKGYLLQDESDALKFISFGPWDNELSIQAWRDTEEFKAFVTKVNDLCDHFQPNLLRVVATSE